MSLDFLAINSLQVKSHIGCTKEERQWPQVMIINAKLFCSFKPSAKSDDLTQTLDYVSAIETISQICREGERKLLERLLGDIIDGLFQKFSLLEKIEISVDKRVSELCQSVTASTVRERI